MDDHMQRSLVRVNDELRQFHLSNGRISMILGVAAGKLVNLYTGAAVPDSADFGYLHDDRFRVQSSTVDERTERFVEQQRLEYPEFGRGDYRHPAIEVAQPNGSRLTDLQYVGYSVSPGKPALAGLPATFAGGGSVATTLDIVLCDELIGLAVTLRYTIFRDDPVIARSALIENRGMEPLTLERAASFNLDLPDADYTMTEFTGAWARERTPRTQPLHPGIQQIESLRGASGPYFSPNAIFARPATTEDEGEAFGLAFVYSGNFDLHAEVDTYGAARLQLGINPLGFAWRLEPGESFQTPEALLGYTDRGLNTLSQSFHRAVLDHLQRPQWARRERPILINNWEATYFDFTEDKLLDLARLAKRVGIELFVLDDGWFGARTSDNAGLGDWTANPDRLPEGIAGIARKINDLGMDFGLWFEPEMVNKDSDVARNHPDWILSPTAGRLPLQGRTQQVLDLTNPEAFDYIYSCMDQLVGELGIDYIKWDHNKLVTEPGSRRSGRPAVHAQTIAVYEIFRGLKTAHPGLEIESCSSGGGRVDLGILEYADRIWVSDCVDPVERADIQRYTSLLVPPAMMGEHVGASPAHSTRRETSQELRMAMAFFGHMGIEWNLLKEPDDALAKLAVWVAEFKKHRDWFAIDTCVHADSSDPAVRLDGMVMPNRNAAIYRFAQLTTSQTYPAAPVHLPGLDPKRKYRISPLDPSLDLEGLTNGQSTLGWWNEEGVVLTGEALQRYGIRPPSLHPQQAVLFKAVALS